jgi:nitric oxide reductase NorE protein
MLLAESSSPTDQARHIPGEAGVCVFIMGDMLIFGLFFAVFCFYRGQQPELFTQSQQLLNVHYGALNTLLLLTSSWFVVMAVNAVRKQLRVQAMRLFVLAFACGAGFSLVKIIEYREKIEAGLYLTSNDFFMYYYIFTGLHFVHVIIGMLLLAFVILKLRAPSQPEEISFFEVAASYWHMVDVLWIILFPLIYLLK